MDFRVRSFKSLIALLLICSFPSSMASEQESFSYLYIDANYDYVRSQLIHSGWEFIAAKCSPDNLCLSDTPELATDMKTFRTCAIFLKGQSELSICVRPIMDGLKVKSFEKVR